MQTNQPKIDQDTKTRPNWIRRLYDWVLMLGEHPQAIWVLFVVSFAEASFFPIPPDVLLLAMAMAAPQRALWFALVCTLGSVLGGIAGYTLGWGLWSSVDQFFFANIPGFTEEKFALMAEKFADNAFITIFTAGFTLIPFKIFTIAAGAAAVPLTAFILGAIVSRGLRFGLLALLIRLFGPGIKHWIDRYFNLITIVGTLVLIAAVIIWQQYH